MRKFIVSDLHGDGIIYDSIMDYLDDISYSDKVTLYINGDLIDRGNDSFRMLIDVINRINGKGYINIEYLAGNHELMLYQAYLNRKSNGKFRKISDWYFNGGRTLGRSIEISNSFIQEEIFNFISNLKIYHAFSDKVMNNNVLLVHAQAPKKVKEECDITLKNNNRLVFKTLWTRKDDSVFIPKKIGKNGYFTIIGHTPVENELGFYYSEKENTLNIDGGCGRYVLGDIEMNHVPLVELADDELLISIFKHDGNIDSTYEFDGKTLKKIR